MENNHVHFRLSVYWTDLFDALTPIWGQGYNGLVKIGMEV